MFMGKYTVLYKGHILPGWGDNGYKVAVTICVKNEQDQARKVPAGQMANGTEKCTRPRQCIFEIAYEPST